MGNRATLTRPQFALLYARLQAEKEEWQARFNKGLTIGDACTELSINRNALKELAELVGIQLPTRGRTPYPPPPLPPGFEELLLLTAKATARLARDCNGPDLELEDALLRYEAPAPEEVEP